MRKITNIIIISFCVALFGQSKADKKKVYRTQWGTMITAPEIKDKSELQKSKAEMKKIRKKIEAKMKKNSQAQRIEIDKLKETYGEQIFSIEEDYKNQISKIKEENDLKLSSIKQDYSSQISAMQENYNFQIKNMLDQIDQLYEITQKDPDTVFNYTNATTTVYDTVVVYDSLYIYNFDTTTVYQTNFDTVVVYDTSFVITYDTTLIRDSLWVFAYDTSTVYDTTWVFAYDTTLVRDSLWVFAYDTLVVYDTTTVVNNDTVTIHTYATNFKPEMIDGQEPQFPVWKTLDDAIRARNSGDARAQEWINEALNAANGDWIKAKSEYKKFQDIYSSSTVRNILRTPYGPEFIGPREQMTYRSVKYDTLRILTFDTLVVKDTIRDLVNQTIMRYDTSIVSNRDDVIQNTTPYGHEMIVRYYDNGNVKERGPMKGRKRNGTWVFYSANGSEIRRASYEMGRITNDLDLVNNEKKSVKRKLKEIDRPKSMAKVVYKKYDAPPKPKSRIVPVTDVMHPGGVVNLQFIVDRDGNVPEISVIKSSSIKDLDRAAVKSIKETKFSPATIKNLPVSVWTELELIFPANPNQASLSAGITKDDFYNLYQNVVSSTLEKIYVNFSSNDKSNFLDHFISSINETYLELEALHYEEETRFLKSEIQNFIFHMENDEGTLQSGVQLYRATSDSRITLIDQNGNVLAESHLDKDGIATMDKHDNRPEIISSKISEYGVSIRSSETLKKKFIYVAHAVDDDENNRRIYVRFSKPLDNLRDQRLLRLYEQEIKNSLISSNVSLSKNQHKLFMDYYSKGLKDKLAELGYGVNVDSNEKIIRSFTDKLAEKGQEVANDLKIEIDTFIDYLRSNEDGSLQESAVSYAQSAGVRVTLIAEDGVVLADSDMDLLQLSAIDNHLNRPEIAQANTIPYGISFRFSKSLQEQLVYVARKLTDPVQEINFIRLSRSVRQNYAKIRMGEDEIVKMYISTIKKSFNRSNLNFDISKVQDFEEFFPSIVKERNNKLRMNENLKNYRLFLEEINLAMDKANLIISEKQEREFLDVYVANVKRELSSTNNLNPEANEESVRTYLKNLAATQEKLKNRKLRQGMFTDYHENGRIKLQGKYIAGRKEGSWREYNKRGRLVKTSLYKKGKVVDIEAQDTFKDLAVYFDNGRIKEQGKTKNGKRHGMWKLYDQKGKLTSTINYSEGLVIQKQNSQRIEKFATYHNNGRLKEEGFIKNGKKDGAWKSYNMRGKLTKSAIYANGEVIRIDVLKNNNESKEIDELANVTYHDNGRIKTTGKLIKNKKHGEWRQYDDRGSVLTISLFNNGELLFEQSPNKVQPFISYHSNGRIKEQGMLKGAERDGEWYLYSKRGKLLRKTNYHQGNIIDQSSTKIIDSFVTYHSNGFVKEEGILKMGQRDGVWKMYDDDGDHVETVTYSNGKIMRREKT